VLSLLHWKQVAGLGSTVPYQHTTYYTIMTRHPKFIELYIIFMADAMLPLLVAIIYLLETVMYTITHISHIRRKNLREISLLVEPPTKLRCQGYQCWQSQNASA
jgi:hypothetical protein